MLDQHKPIVNQFNCAHTWICLMFNEIGLKKKIQQKPLPLPFAGKTYIMLIYLELHPLVNVLNSQQSSAAEHQPEFLVLLRI